MNSFDRVLVMVLDGVGAGEAKDTRENYPEDVGANSLLNASKQYPLNTPALAEMGIERIPGLRGLSVTQKCRHEGIRGAFGIMEPTFAGNGSLEGHQALMGHIVKNPYLIFNKTRIPPDILALVKNAAEETTRRNAVVITHPLSDDISGTVFIEHQAIGPVHLESKDRRKPLFVPVYASSDSGVQIPLHQEVVSQLEIEAIGKKLRRKLDASGYRIGRVIMRPFVGEPGRFRRVSEDRRDYGINPDEPTLLDHLSAAGFDVVGIGKAAAMFNGRGFTHSEKFKTDTERLEAAKNAMQGARGLVLTNLIYTDELYGHRRDPKGYVECLATIDRGIRKIQQSMTARDLLVVTSDHGNDPTHKAHTNHTRERVPIFVFATRMHEIIPLGIRASYADLAATLAENFLLGESIGQGKSFFNKFRKILAL